MSNEEYQDLARRMERIERLLEGLSRAGGVRPLPDAGSPEPPKPVTPEMSEADRVKAVQAEGSYILETQGFEAYQRFWKEQGKKRKPRVKRAA